MDNLITVNKKECFIDSVGLASLSENEERSIHRLIRAHKQSLEQFGVLRFEITKPHGVKGGRPKHTYYLTEHQATVLTTFMSNTEKVVEFKIKLVKEFFRMRSYIQKQEVARLAGIKARRTLTDEIRDSGENERMHGHGYSTYTKLAYKMTGLEKGSRDSLNPDDLERLEDAEMLMKLLIKSGQSYNEIKDTLKPIFKDKKDD